MMRRLLAAAALIAVPLFAAPVPAAAASPLTTFAVCRGGVANFLGLQSWDACLQQKNGRPVITKLTDVWLIIIPLIDDIIKILGYWTVGLVIWGGFQYMKSNGDPGKISSAKDTILNAIIGLIVCMLSVAIVQFIAGRF